MQERVKKVEIRLILVERISESLNEMTKKKMPFAWKFYFDNITPSKTCLALQETRPISLLTATS